MATITAFAVATSSMIAPGASGLPAAGAQEQQAAETQPKTAYDSEGKKLEDNAKVNGGEEITYAIEERSDDKLNASDPRTLTDTMSDSQKYVEGSLTEMNKDNPWLTVKEPAADESWAEGKDIATFDPTYQGPAKAEDAGDNNVAEPLFGQNAQYAESVTAEETPRMPTTTGDGYTPNFVRNADGELLVWSLNHHSSTPALACEVVSTHEGCGSAENFWPEMGEPTQQNNATVTIGTRGYMAILPDNGAYSIAGVDFANAKAGWDPNTGKIAPVQILSGVDGDGLLNFFASSLWNDGDKIYMIAFPKNSSKATNMKLGCYDASTGGVCDGFSSEGNIVPVPGKIFPDGSSPRFHFTAEAKLPDGKYTFALSSDRDGSKTRTQSANFCVKPEGTTLVNCDGSSPVRAARHGDANALVPIVNANGDGMVPEDIDYNKVNADRIEGYCVGTTGEARRDYASVHGRAVECFDLEMNSLGNKYPNLPMYDRGWTRSSDSYAYPSGYARVIYPNDYNGENGGEMTCYDFEEAAPCPPSENLSMAGKGGDETADQLTARGVTFLDRQILPDGTDYRGRAYGARMIPESPNCFVTLGDGEASGAFAPTDGGRGAFLYWRMNTDGTVVPGTDCIPTEVHFLDQDARYCTPDMAGMTEWGELRLTAVETGTTNAKAIPKNTQLTWYPYDPETGKITGDALGTQTVGGQDQVAVAKPDFLNYADTKNFTVRVTGQQSGLTYQFTQLHEADGNPTLCYKATPPATCDAAGDDTALTNVAQWTDSPATNEVKLLVGAGGTDCFAVEKEATSGPIALDKDQTDFTAEFLIRVTNVMDVTGTSPEVTDTPSVPEGFTVTGVSVDGKAATKNAAGEYLVSEGVELEPGKSKEFTIAVTGTVDQTKIVTESLGECNADRSETPVKSINNLVSMDGDSDGEDNNWDCVPVTPPEEPGEPGNPGNPDEPATIGDYVWFDEDKDGIQDEGEKGVEGVEVTLTDKDGKETTTTTDADGKYIFEDLTPGEYTVTFDVPEGYDITVTGAGDDEELDSNGRTETVTVEGGDERLDIDLGLIEETEGTAGVGDFVWLDKNKDGLQDDGEPGVRGVTVVLVDGNGDKVGSTKTDASGYYEFTGLDAGDYTVEFTVPTGYSETKSEQGSDRAIDSNGLTTTVTLEDGQFDETIDLGLIKDGETPGQPGNPKIDIIKKINGLDAETPDEAVIVAPGDDMLVTFVVTNTGDVDLHDVKVTDDTIPADKIEAPEGFDGTLAPGEAAVFTATIKAPEADSDTTSHVNVAVAEGTPPSDPNDPNNPGDPNDPDTPPVTSDEDKGHAEVPKLKIIKKINGDDANNSPGVKVTEGEDMDVTFDVTNVGKVALTDLTVIDDTIDAEDIKAPEGFDGTIKPGETVQFTATYPAPKSGVVHKNTAYAEGTPPENPDPEKGVPGEPEYPTTDTPPVKSNEDPAHAHTDEISDEGGSSELEKCFATSSVNSPLIWLIPVGILLGVGGFVGSQMSGQFDGIAGQINAQIRQNFPDWGQGGIAFEKPEWMAEIEAQFNAINGQLNQINPNIGPAVGGIAIVLAVLGATSAVWNICGNEGAVGSSGSSEGGSSDTGSSDGGSSEDDSSDTGSSDTGSGEGQDEDSSIGSSQELSTVS